MSVNLELLQKSLALLCPQKRSSSFWLRCADSRLARQKTLTRVLPRKNTTYYRKNRPAKHKRAFAPAGQSTQMIVGATPENDFQILNLSAALYRTLSLKRVFFSAYLPVTSDERLPASGAVESRPRASTYQADWLMRFYKFDVSEIIDEENPYLDPQLDPKATGPSTTWEHFPRGEHRPARNAPARARHRPARGAPYREGPAHMLPARTRAAQTRYRLQARTLHHLQRQIRGNRHAIRPRALRAQLAAPIDGGKHGRRAAKQCQGQLSLFDTLEGQNQHGKRIEEAQARDAFHNAQGTSAHDAPTNSARADVDDALKISCKASTSSTPMTAQKTSISSLGVRTSRRKARSPAKLTACSGGSTPSTNKRFAHDRRRRAARPCCLRL